jgi:hypothetical protein
MSPVENRRHPLQIAGMERGATPIWIALYPLDHTVQPLHPCPSWLDIFENKLHPVTSLQGGMHFKAKLVEGAARSSMKRTTFASAESSP